MYNNEFDKYFDESNKAKSVVVSSNVKAALNTNNIETQVSEVENEEFVPVEGYSTYTEYIDENVIVNISGDKRITNFNEQVSVQGESDAQYIVFEMNRYCEGIDLGEKRIQIHYERPDGLGDNSPPVNVEMSDKRIRFGWIVPAMATEVNGRLKVMPFVYGNSPVTGSDIYIMKTLYTEYEIRNGLRIDGGIKKNDEWYNQFLIDMLNYVSEARKHALESLDNAELAKEEKEEIDKIRIHIVELVEQIKTIEYDISEFYSIKNEVKQSENTVLGYVEEVKKIVGSIGGVLIPYGTIKFEELPSDVIVGATYNISNDFITDDRFIEGSGHKYKLGTNVYYTNIGKWDVLTGVLPTKDDLGLNKVENKSSEEIRGELTEKNITDALGYKPPEKDTNTTYEIMKGATESTDGNSGLVPSPLKGNNDRYLRSDGTWEVPQYVKGTYVTLNGKKLSEFRSMLDSIANYSGANFSALSSIRANAGNLIIVWNNNDENTAFTAGPSHTFTLIATYTNSDYQAWLVSTYSENKNYVVIKSDGNWGQINKIGLEKNFPTVPGLATVDSNGLMSALDKKKLDGITDGAGNYILPVATSTVRGGVKIGYDQNDKNYPVKLDDEKMYVNVPWTDHNTEYGNATQSLSGLMSSGDKKKLDGLAKVAETGSYLDLSNTPNIPSTPTAESIGAIPKYLIDYTSSTKEDALNKLNIPTLLVGAIVSPYCILFRDNVGDSPLGGGTSCVFGYIYSGGNYGAQIAIKYISSSGRFMIRNLNSNVWSDWARIYDTIYKPTPADIGLGNVNNTSDANKNVLSAKYLKGDNYEDLSGKTITRIREVLDSCTEGMLSSRQTGVFAIGFTSSEDWISNWDKNDEESVLSTGALYVFLSLVRYTNANSQVWMVSTYEENRTHIIIKSAGKWGKVNRIGLEKNFPTVSSLGITSIQTIATLSTGSWTGSEAPYSYNLSVQGVTSTSIVDIDVQSSITVEQLEAYINAKIIGGEQSTNSITLKAFGEKPKVNIPINIVVRKV